MKRWIAACAVGFMMTAQMTAYASSEMYEPHMVAACITKEEAREAVEDYIAEDCKFQFGENKGNVYEVVYYSESQGEYYKIKLDSQSGDIMMYKSWIHGHKGSKNVTLSEDEAMETVTSEISEAENLEVKLDYENGNTKVYRIYFDADGMQGFYEINPENGTVLERQIEIDS